MEVIGELGKWGEKMHEEGDERDWGVVGCLLGVGRGGEGIRVRVLGIVGTT